MMRGVNGRLAGLGLVGCLVAGCGARTDLAAWLDEDPPAGDARAEAEPADATIPDGGASAEAGSSDVATEAAIAGDAADAADAGPLLPDAGDAADAADAGPLCTDLQTAANCGTCGQGCGGDWYCNAGQCQAVPSAAFCGVLGGATVDLSSDNANCGGCGQSCADTCTAGRCVTTVASGQDRPIDIAVDDAHLYWLNEGQGADGSVMQADLDGGALIALATGLDVPTALALDGTSVYWTNYGPDACPAGGPCVSQGTVMKVPIGGGAVTTLASGQVHPQGIAVDTTSVYFTTDTQIMKVPLGGGAVTVVSDSCASASSAPPEPHMAVGAGNVYFTAVGKVWKAPVSGGACTLAGGGPTAATAIALDTTTLYWAGGNSATGNTALAGGRFNWFAPPDNEPPDAYAIAVDTQSLYYTAGYGSSRRGGAPPYLGALMKGAASGGTVINLAIGHPVGVAVGAKGVYWTDLDGTIREVTPK
jgi:hypothetical protein